MRLLLNKQVNTPKNFYISGFLPEFKNEVIIDGAYYFSENNALHVSGSLRTEISVCCDRCLKSFTSVLQTTFEEEFMSKDLAKTYYAYDNEGIDLDGIMYEILQSAMPEKFLCSESCKGLCDQCGIDLNKSICQCDTREINPKFEMLRSLLLED
ncbi:hypothetical protein AZF37_04555 [endosymbiont 'TC1' of Trimyema compressum]|nr:hypothetical protein AZF37_04555 [endosymbiont 'TC1' of Trimyema compressum]